MVVKSSPDHNMTLSNSTWSQNQVINDAVETSLQNIKTVECRLRRTFEKIADTEANIHLFETLKRMGLATNDVSNFFKKQENHKRVKSCPNS